MPKVEKELRCSAEPVAVETRDDGTQMLVGYAAVFDVETDLGWFREVVRPGAFKRALSDGADVRALWNHDSGVVLGRTKSGTLTLKEDKKGLRYEVELPDTQAAKDAATVIRRGDVSGSSFGFTVAPRGDRWQTIDDEGTQLRELIDLDPFDVSPVTYPAYADTTVAMRSAEKVSAEFLGRKERERERQLRLAESETGSA